MDNSRKRIRMQMYKKEDDSKTVFTFFLSVLR